MQLGKQEITAIIFDLGGVLLNIDYNAPVRAFAEFGVTGFDTFYSKAKQSRLFDDFETGKISPSEFRNAIRKQTGLTINDEDFDHAWNSILLDLPAERIELLRTLRKQVPVFLLSNTNEIHVRAFEAGLVRVFGSNVFKEVFHRHYYSCRMNARKPDAGCFLQVVRENNLNPEKTLFIDDSPQHVEGARKAGLQSIHLKSDIISLFNDLLIREDHDARR